jgi:hypothetical protein
MATNMNAPDRAHESGAHTTDAGVVDVVLTP